MRTKASDIRKAFLKALKEYVDWKKDLHALYNRSYHFNLEAEEDLSDGNYHALKYRQGHIDGMAAVLGVTAKERARLEQECGAPPIPELRCRGCDRLWTESQVYISMDRLWYCSWCGTPNVADL